MDTGYVLIVEDDPDLRELLTLTLEAEGYTVGQARNGAEALEQLRGGSEKPRLILLDLRMPIMNGWQFRDLQRKDPELADIPVVIVSADVPPGPDLRAVAFLQKPIQPEELIATVQRYAA